jgi:hypothetical protein
MCPWTLVSTLYKCCFKSHSPRTSDDDIRQPRDRSTLTSYHAQRIDERRSIPRTNSAGARRSTPRPSKARTQARAESNGARCVSPSKLVGTRHERQQGTGRHFPVGGRHTAEWTDTVASHAGGIASGQWPPHFFSFQFRPSSRVSHPISALSIASLYC